MSFDDVASPMDWSDENCCPFGDDEEQSCSSSCTRSVRFSTEPDQVFEITHIQDFTQEEIRATWYCGEEYERMYTSNQQVITMMQYAQDGGTIVESDTITTRGLEIRTSEGGGQRRQNKAKGYKSVLAEQECQWTVNQTDQDKISSLYQAATSHCQAEALVRGLQDEQAVRKYAEQEQIELESSNIHMKKQPPKPPASVRSSLKQRACRLRAAVLDDIELLRRPLHLSERNLGRAAAA